MEEAAAHVLFQLPNKITQVGFLLSDIKYLGEDLQATMANIKSDADPKSARSKRNHFKMAVTYLL
eukprot:10327848-Ditylum_brightwellii.AAC.1